MQKHMGGPLLTLKVSEALLNATGVVECSLDLELSRTTVEVDATGWRWQGRRFPHLRGAKDRTIYYWEDERFQPVSRYAGSLIKLVPTDWGAPTFEIDGIKMLPTERVSPYADAKRKVGLVEPRGKVILDTCGGLGYFAVHCLLGACKHTQSYEKNEEVIWLRGLNPWSPTADPRLTLTHGDVAEQITALPAQSFDAVLHDPPRFGIAGELYSQNFYDHLARVLKPRGKLFHYTGAPNKLTSGRDVPNEVATRLRHAGFATELNGDGVLGVRKHQRS
jgi:predicted methyltransferase